jgi:hypothetical protein
MSNCLRRSILPLALGLLIAACATSPEQQAQRDNEQCAARGHAPGSKAHDDCVSRVLAQREARLQARHRELVERPATPFNY